ncbi:MAG TPA: ribosome recycling factor [Candidatus Nanoarchaeia archaeon]|nr:ribosome recycling factor [Candidatus Nanoarchaeia archaeon]
MAYNFSDLKKRVKDVENWLSKEYTGIRTGRATPSILDNVRVESYGSMMPISQVASITSEGAKSLRVVPWDTAMNKVIEKAIVEANLGLSVSVDEKGVRVMFPDLTAERRQSLIKLSKQKLEDARISLRKERDLTWDDIQKKEEDGSVTEDEKFRLKNEMQKIVDETGKKLQEFADKKEQEMNS